MERKVVLLGPVCTELTGIPLEQSRACGGMPEAFMTNPYHNGKQKCRLLKKVICFHLIRIARKGFSIVVVVQHFYIF